jgi:hypothetical protein
METNDEEIYNTDGYRSQLNSEESIYILLICEQQQQKQFNLYISRKNNNTY